MACLNITSLSKHIDELRVLLQNNSLDLLAINETLFFIATDADLIISDGFIS